MYVFIKCTINMVIYFALQIFGFFLRFNPVCKSTGLRVMTNFWFSERAVKLFTPSVVPIYTSSRCLNTDSAVSTLITVTPTQAVFMYNFP